MNFVSEIELEKVKKEFDDLSPHDVHKEDKFFTKLFRFIQPKNTDRQLERLNDYEELLKLLRKWNLQRYEQFHKGTPFFWAAYLFFVIRNYEKALFYLDAAIYEDIKNEPENWINLPSPLFLNFHKVDTTLFELPSIYLGCYYLK